MKELKKIGFIGLGLMGRGMALNLLKKGFQVAVYDIVDDLIKELATSGAIATNSPREVAEASDVMISIVRDSLETEEVIFGQKGLWEGIKNGSTIIISSTLEPQYCQRVQEKVKEKNVRILDAPCTGARWGAEAGTLSFMVGGEKAVFEECYPVFEAMGKDIFYMGNVGQGEVMKLVHQLVLLANMASASQAISVGLKAGIDLERLLEVISASTGRSWIIENWNQLVALREDYEKGKLREAVPLFYKDMGIALKLAKDMGMLLPLAGLLSQLDTSQWFPDKPPAD